MQLSLSRFRIGAFVSALLFLAALPSQAQFGGVFTDPVQSAHALQQIAQNVENSATWQQQLANTIQLLATADKDYSRPSRLTTPSPTTSRTSAASRYGGRSSHSLRW